MRRLFPLLFLLLCFIGCGHERLIYVPGPVTRDTVYEGHSQSDTLVCHDSIYVDRWRSGDTVYVNKYVDRYVYRNRDRVDTVYRVRVDSVPVVKEVIPEGYIKPSGWDRFLMGYGNWFFWFCVGAVVFVVGRFLYRVYFRR